MTATIDSIKPGEVKEIQVEDRLEERALGPNIVTRYSNFAYLDPSAEVGGWSFSFRLPGLNREWQFIKNDGTMVKNMKTLLTFFKLHQKHILC